MGADPTRILVVDDDLGVLNSLKAVLLRSGFQVSAAPSVPIALKLIAEESFDVLLTDLNISQPGDGFTIVGAMRRVQPHVCTFILTGYPDIESAVQAIRSQVDDYFSKPLDIHALLAAIDSVRNGRKPAPKSMGSKKVSYLLLENSSLIQERWYEQIMQDEDLAALPLSKKERINHIPELLSNIIARIKSKAVDVNATTTESSRRHGIERSQQGYSISHILFEMRVLQQVISFVIQEHLLTLELSTLAPDILAIGESLQAEVEIFIRGYQSHAARSIQTSFSMLYKSPHLGVVTADETRVIDANDAFLKMIGRSRDELINQEIDWRAMTPAKFRQLDLAAIDQLREFGAAAPFEKEFILPDGSTLPFLIGAVRLAIEPLQWSAYVVNLTEQRKVQAAERKIREWEARYSLINRLAHEVNNPLAALVFTFHLLGTHPGLTPDMELLVSDANGMLERISATIQRVLIESEQ